MFDGPVSKPLYRCARTVLFSAVLVVESRVLHKSWAVSLAMGGGLLVIGTALAVYCVYQDRHLEVLEQYSCRRGS